MRTRSTLVAWLLAVALVLVLAGCGSSSKASGSPTTLPSNTTAAGTSFPVTVTGGNGTVTIPTAPKRIVSLSASSTEDLFAIGAGPQVVAVDDQSNYPANAPKTKLSGLTPNAEAIAGYNPDLVVMDSTDAAKALKVIHVPLLVMPAPSKLDDAYTQITTLGTATGHVADATNVVSTMRNDIANIVASVPKRTTPITYYHELDDTLYTVTSNTFIGNVYSMLGLKNIADAAKDASSGYPQLSAEFLISANPDYVFLADTKCCKQSAATVAARPGWSTLRAVTEHHVVPLDDDIASRWGPRVVDFLRVVADALKSASP